MTFTIPEGVRKIVGETFAEDEAKRYREESDRKFRDLQNTPMAKLGPDEPLPFNKLTRPDWMQRRGYDTPDQEQPSTAAPTFVPPESDPARDYTSLGQSPLLTQADIKGDPIPATYNALGTGGPQDDGPLSEADIIELKKVREDRAKAGVRSSLMQQPGSPDDAAKAIELAKEAGVDRSQVEQNRKSYEYSKTAKDIDALTTTAPKFRTWLDSARENLEVAHDDVQNLGWWEQAQSAFDPGSLTLEEIGGALRTGAVEGGQQQFFGAAEQGIGIARMFEWLPGVKNLLDEGEKEARKQRQMAALKALANMPRGDTTLERGIYGAFQSAPASIEALGVSLLTRSGFTGAAAMGVGTSGQSYGEAEDAGKPFWDRMRYALEQGTVETVTEMIPLKFLIGDLAKDAPLGKIFFHNALSEGIGEQAATFLQDASTWLELHPDKTVAEFLAERPNAAMETLIASTLMTGMQTTLAAGVQQSGVMLNEQAQQKRAEQLSKTFEAMRDGAKDSKLLTRLPDKYREAVAAATKDGPLENVRVAPEAFTELAQSAGVTNEQLAQAFRIDPNDIVTALDAGEDVVIPAGNYAAALKEAKKEIGVSGETIHSAFAPNMRLRADDFTAKEREAMKAVYEEEQKARAEAGTKEQSFADSADRVRETIREQVAGLKIFNTEAANTQAAIIGEMVTTLAERTGQDPEALWKEQGFDVVAAIKGEPVDETALPQGGDRAPIEVSDEIVNRASEALTEYEFAVWKAAALEGRSNKEIADDPDISELRNRVGGMQPDMLPSAVNVGAILTKARAKGFDVGPAKRGRGDSIRDDVRRLMRQGLNAKQIHDRLGRTDEQYNSTKAMVSKLKKEMREQDALAQEKRGTFSPREDRSIIRLFESSNLSTLSHEASHWYLDTLWRMSQTENPHPFVMEQIAAILEWQGKSPNWTAMFDENGKFTDEGRDIQEAFAETFEAYLRDGKAPTSALRSVFATFKAWLTRIYRSLSQIGSRVRLNDEIRQVFDRMLASEDAIKAVTTGMAQDGKTMAEAIIAKTGENWSDERKAKFTERMTERYAKAREQAEAELMARLMDDYERNQKAWWRDEERQVRREVQSEVDERPEQRAYSWLSGKGWRDTREAHIEAAFTEAQVMGALAQAPELGFFEANATDESLKALHARMVDNGIIPVILLFKTTSGRVIAFPGDTGDFGFHHDLARQAFGLGDLKLEHGVYNPRRWPTIEAMNEAGPMAWYDTTGTQSDTQEASPFQDRKVTSLAQTGTEGLLVYRGSAEDEIGEMETGRLGSGLYSAEDPEIGAEWGGESGKVDAYRIKGKLFDLDETTAQGIENYQKREDTPQAQALFARLKAEGYVGVRDPWSGHINVFDARDMQRVPSEDKELGTTWTNFVEDEDAVASLAQTRGADLSTREARLAWANSENVVSEPIGSGVDGERRFGFRFISTDRDGNPIDDAVLVSVLQDPSRGSFELVWDWHSTEALKERDTFEPAHDLKAEDVFSLMRQILALVERDMVETGRSAYIFQPNTDKLALVYEAVLQREAGRGLGYAYKPLKNGEMALVHPNANISRTGEMIDENPAQRLPEGVEVADVQADQDEYYSRVLATADAVRGPAGRRNEGPVGSRRGADALAQTAGPPRQLDAMGFYSAAQEAAQRVPDNIWNMGWQAARNALAKGRDGIAPRRTEIEYLGLDAMFGDTKLKGAELKAAVLEHIAAKRLSLKEDFVRFDPNVKPPTKGVMLDQLQDETLADAIELEVSGQVGEVRFLVDKYEVYLRKGRRVDERGELVTTLDLASIQRTDSENASFEIGRAPNEKPGDFRELVARLEQEARDNGLDAVYIENVFNEFLPDVFRRYGYTQMPGGFPHSFIKHVDGGAGSLAQSAQPSRSLVVMHNLTEQNLFHAEEIGGLAAPSLAVVDTDKGVLSNFGGISLVADPSFLSTSKVRTFDADIYSPRHPRPLYDIDDKAASVLVKELREATTGLGDLHDIDLDALHKDGPSSLIRNEMVKAAFFASRGELPKRLPRKEIPQADIATKEAAALDVIAKEMWDVRDDPRVRELAADHYTHVVEATRANDAELADDLHERFFTETDEGKTIVHPNYLHRFILDAKAYRKAAAREIDTIELGSMLSKKLRDKKTEAAFEEYVEALAARIITGKSLFKGFTNAGNRRYGDYTMETILREMTQELQGGENWHYGAGSVRAKYANELKSLSAIRARKDQLVSEEEMKAAKDEGQNALMEILEYLRPYYRFGGGNQFMQMDDMSKALMEGPKGIREAFDFKGDPEPQARIREFINLLTDLPTEYFEAKARRAVDLSEFTAAIVPRGTSERALEILRKAGLQIRFYARDNAADRARAIRGVSSALFQSGDTKGRTSPPPNLPPMRLNLQAVKDQYGEQALKDLPPQVAAYSAQATDADQFLQVAHDVRKTLKQKKPKSLWKFLSTSRIIGSGNDKIAYRGIRDDGGEIMKIIGEKKAAPGLISDTEDAKKVRSYTIEQAAMAAYEAGYFNGQNPPGPAEFLDALRSDFDGQAQLYARDDIPTVQQIKAAEQWADWFDQNGIDISEKDDAALKAQLELVLTSTNENAIGPDEAAPFFGMTDGKALLDGLKEGPKRDQLIREMTRQRMVERHGDIFKDGTMMQEAQVYARNEIASRQIEIELEALARAGGQQIAANLAKQQAIENLRSKQVREVLNYNQWLILEQRWGKKALEAAQKGKFDDAARYKKYQLLNFHMFREGRKLAEDIEKARKHLIAYGTKPRQARLFAAGPEYAEQMNGLLDDYQLRNESRKAENKRQARGAWIAAQMASIDPYAAYQDTTKSAAEQQVAAAEALERSRTLANLSEGVEAKNYKSITVEELLGVKDEADLIWKLATLKDRLLKEGERRRLTLAAEDIAAEIETNQPNAKPPEPIETDSPGAKVKRGVLKYFAMHRQLQSLAHQFAGGKDGGKFWSYIIKPLNSAYAHLSDLRKQMGSELDNLFSAYSKEERARFYKDRQHFASLGVSLTKQGRLAVALNWGNEKNRQRLMDSTGWSEAGIQEVLDTLDKRDWDFLQATWDYLDTWFPEANRVHEAIHGAPMDKVQPLPIATRFGIYKGGYYPIAFDPELSSKSGQRRLEADAKQMSGRIGVRSAPGFSKKRVEGKVTLPLKLSVFDVLTRHLDQVATSIATEEALFDAGRLVKHPEVERAIVERHGREIYNTIVQTLVTSKFGLQGASGWLAHLRNGATVVGLGWKVSTALLQPLGVTNSIVRVGGYWIAKGYARMGKDAATIQSSANWIMQRSAYMRNRRRANSPELSALRSSMKKDGVTPRWLIDSMFSLMSNVQFYSVDMPTWYGAWYKAKAAGLDEAEAIAQADQAVIDAQGGGEVHQTAAIQTGAGTNYAAALRLLTNFMSYMVTTYNLATQRVRNARSVPQIAALSLDMILMLAIPVAGKMALDAFTKGGGGDDDDDLWEKYGREQAAFLMSPFVGFSQIAGAARGDDAYGYRGPAGLGIFAEGTNAAKAAAELDFDESFWRPANKAAGMVFHYPASQLDATVRGAMALWNGETTNPGVIFFGPPPKN